MAPNLQKDKNKVIHDMTNYMFLRVKTMKQEKNKKNYQDIVRPFLDSRTRSRHMTTSTS